MTWRIKCTTWTCGTSIHHKRNLLGYVPVFHIIFNMFNLCACDDGRVGGCLCTYLYFVFDGRRKFTKTIHYFICKSWSCSYKICVVGSECKQNNFCTHSCRYYRPLLSTCKSLIIVLITRRTANGIQNGLTSIAILL